MLKVLLLYDRISKRWLRWAHDDPDAVGEMAWTDNESEASYFEPERLPDVLWTIQHNDGPDVAIQVIEVYASGLADAVPEFPRDESERQTN